MFDVYRKLLLLFFIYFSFLIITSSKVQDRVVKSRKEENSSNRRPMIQYAYTLASISLYVSLAVTKGVSPKGRSSRVQWWNDFKGGNERKKKWFDLWSNQFSTISLVIVIVTFPFNGCYCLFDDYFMKRGKSICILTPFSLIGLDIDDVCLKWWDFINLSPEDCDCWDVHFFVFSLWFGWLELVLYV